jgi:transposase-like protein
MSQPIERPLCPDCGSDRTRKNNGPYHFSAVYIHQRWICRECNAKWIMEWEGRFFRKYESREVAKTMKKKDTGQMALPGMS